MAPLVAECLRARWTGLVCLAVVLTALLLPPGGFLKRDGQPVPMCQFKEITHLPCPACGLTRCFIAMAHLNVPRALRFHPVGAVLFLLVLGLALLVPVPSLRERSARWTEGHPLAVNIGTITLLTAFVLYGVGRIVWLVNTGTPSIW